MLGWTDENRLYEFGFRRTGAGIFEKQVDVRLFQLSEAGFDNFILSTKTPNVFEIYSRRSMIKIWALLEELGAW